MSDDTVPVDVFSLAGVGGTVIATQAGSEIILALLLEGSAQPRHIAMDAHQCEVLVRKLNELRQKAINGQCSLAEISLLGD